MNYRYKIKEIKRMLKSPIMKSVNKSTFYSRFTSLSSLDDLDSLYCDIKNLYESLGDLIGSHIRVSY